MGGPASRPGSRGHAVIWNGKTLLKPMVKKHTRLVQEFYLLEQRWVETSMPKKVTDGGSGPG